jgi:hypothetical protein
MVHKQYEDEFQDEVSTRLDNLQNQVLELEGTVTQLLHAVNLQSMSPGIEITFIYINRDPKLDKKYRMRCWNVPRIGEKVRPQAGNKVVVRDVLYEANSLQDGKVLYLEPTVLLTDADDVRELQLPDHPGE